MNTAESVEDVDKTIINDAVKEEAPTPDPAEVDAKPDLPVEASQTSEPPPSTETVPSTPSKPPPTAPIPASPAIRRPKPPTKGILKPPPPPGKPTLSNRLRDIAGVAKSLFDPLEDPQSQSPQSPQTNGSRQVEAEAGPSVSSAFTAFSGRLGAGFNRLVVAAQQQAQSSPGQNGGGTPNGSPLGIRSMSLPEVIGTPFGGSEKSRQKQPLKRATFVLPSLSITYPISSQGEPWSLKVVEDRDRVCHPSLNTKVVKKADDRLNRVIELSSPLRPGQGIGRMKG
jgi:protein phosphatase 1 regulatory subunit 37